jgi:2'-5' RNA ligase
MRQQQDIRIFFALWPEDSLRKLLQRVSESIDVDLSTCRRVAESNLHMTLHFIGNVSFSRMDEMREQAARVEAESFSMAIDHLGCFSQAKVFWLGCDQLPAALKALQSKLGVQLASCNFEAEARPYNPHVTIVRKASVNDLPLQKSFAPLHWLVENFALIESRSTASGVQYRVMQTYPLS